MFDHGCANLSTNVSTNVSANVSTQLLKSCLKQIPKRIYKRGVACTCTVLSRTFLSNTCTIVMHTSITQTSVTLLLSCKGGGWSCGASERVLRNMDCFRLRPRLTRQTQIARCGEATGGPVGRARRRPDLTEHRHCRNEQPECRTLLGSNWTSFLV